MKPRPSFLFVALALLLPLSPCLAHGQNWAHWRGPNYDGSTAAKNLPTDFSKTDKVLWAAPMPGPSAATPVIWDDRVFVSSSDPEAGELYAMCLDRKTGKTLWKEGVNSRYQPNGAGNAIQLDDKSNYASPSPVTDGKRVVFFYGNGDLVAFKPDGTSLWSMNLQKKFGDFSFQWTFASSPTLYENALYMQVLQRDEPAMGRGKEGNESFLLKMDPDSGDIVWKHVRPAPAQMESLESYATPIPNEGARRKELLIIGGDVITGHDPDSGQERWRWGTWNPGHKEQWWRLVPSPVVGKGVVLACGPKRAPVFAVKLGGEGNLGPEGLAWSSEEKGPVTSDVPTPLFYEGKFYVLSDLRTALSRVDPATGKVEWTVEMPGKHLWRGSPTGADGKIWCMNHGGTVLVVAAETGETLQSIDMGTPNDNDIRSSIAVAHDQLFIRTNDTLYCIGNES